MIIHHAISIRPSLKYFLPMKHLFDFLKVHQSNIIKGFLFLMSIILLVIIFPKEGKFKYEFQRGRPWMHRDLIATYNIAILKPEDEVEQERKNILAQIKPYFVYDEELTKENREKLAVSFEENWNEKYKDVKISDRQKNLNCPGWPCHERNPRFQTGFQASRT